MSDPEFAAIPMDGHPTAMPTEAIAALGAAMASRKPSRSLLRPAGVFFCFLGGKLAGESDPVFGASQDGPDPEPVSAEDAGRMLLSLAEPGKLDGFAAGLESDEEREGVVTTLLVVVPAVIQFVQLILSLRKQPVHPAP